MAISYSIPYLPESIPVSLQFAAAGIILFVLSFVYSTLTAERPWPGFPIISVDGLGPKTSWFKRGTDTILKGLEQTSGPFQVISGTGPKIVVPTRFADELKANESLSFNEAFQKDFFSEYPGFEPHKQGLHDDSLIQEVVRVKLTQSLGLITGDLVEETTMSLHDLFGEDAEWHSMLLKEKTADLVARLSSRVFLGKDLCRNQRWLDIAKNYTIDSFIASRLLRMVPSVFRPIAHWFMPHCIRLRKEYRDAQKLINPEVDRRKERAQKALEAGQKPPKTADTIGWMYEISRGRQVNYVAAQLSLTLAAIHTTTEAITQALLDLCANPHIFQPLREEVINVVGAEGWSKTVLYKLRLMDSFLKESQRFHPPGFTSMNRLVKSSIQLSDGTVLPKGARIMVPSKYSDPAVYPDPGTFDPYRFLREREKPGQINAWQHVTTSAEHMGFGHGQHACPGRFFASNEIKIALAQLILKYDWRFEGQGPAKNMEFEGSTMTDPNVKVMLRRREEEIDVDATGKSVE